MSQRFGLLRLAACAAALSFLCGCNNFPAVSGSASASEAESESAADSVEDDWLFGYFSGYDDGKSKGFGDGFSYGEDSAYSVDCYPVPFDDATDPTYDNGYYQGYHHQYSTGWLEGFIEGYYSVHNEIDLGDLVRHLNTMFGPFDLE